MYLFVDSSNRISKERVLPTLPIVSWSILILFGNNAQGKTNLLEALYMSGTSKSYKGVRDRELIKFNQIK